jgi:DNA-binding Lrp family transcriptional regulator
MMNLPTILDGTSRRILQALDREPRATVAWLSENLRLARGTVQSRIGEIFTPGTLRPHSVTVRPESLGYTVRALVAAEVDQDQFEKAMAALREIPEVMECVATAGQTDLFLQVVARDTDDLYRIGQRILRCPGIRRTAASIVIQELIPYRTSQLL